LEEQLTREINENRAFFPIKSKNRFLRNRPSHEFRYQYFYKIDKPEETVKEIEKSNVYRKIKTANGQR
jgi:SH3-like domain-containing protein